MEKKPTFFWQAALILLPLALLVAVGVYSLRQDKALAEAEAKERAQIYADELQRKIGGTLTGLASTDDLALAIADVPTFGIETNGDLFYPERIATLVPSVLSPKLLTAQQRRLWEVATTAEFTTNRPTAIEAYRAFLNSDPPAHHAARAAYSLALLLGNGDEAKALLTRLQSITDETSDAGLPLNLLAEMKLVEFEFATGGHSTTNAVRLEKLCHHAIEEPSLLTEQILNLAEHLAPYSFVHETKRFWDRSKLACELYDSCDKMTAPFPPFFWITFKSPIASGDTYIGILQSPDSFVPARKGPGQRTTAQPFTGVACYPAVQVRETIGRILHSLPNAPEYFGFTVQLAGRDLTSLNARPWRETSHFSPRGDPPGTVTKKEFLALTNAVLPVLATASGSGATDTLKVNVVLTNRDALFKTQQARRNWFGVLIFASAVVAGSGLWRSWRTFTRQQQLNEMKSNFVSSVSHELRAPIASVRLLAEALDRGAVSEQPKQKEYFRFIVQECRRLTGLIENVLDFSRIEQGRKNYHFEETDLNALVEQTIKLMRPMADERGVELQRSEFDVQCSTFNVVCDGLAIQQGLVNLVDNAIKHSPSGKKVLIALENEHRTLNETPPASIRLSVADQGPGIPPEDHERIFERFYRRGSELRRETQGIGIGLTIVKHVAEAHGGRVIVESAVGKGSKFTIELPAKQLVDSKHEARNPNQIPIFK